jgi:hypothetical protein
MPALNHAMRCRGSPWCISQIFAFSMGGREKTAAAWTGGSPAGRGDETMTINPFDLTAIAGFMAVGLWLDTVGGKHGFADEFFAPIPLAATGCIYAVLRSLIY